LVLASGSCKRHLPPNATNRKTLAASIKQQKKTTSMTRIVNFLKQNWWILILCGFLLVSLIGVFLSIRYYWVQFNNYHLSTNPTDWGVFGDYFGGTLNPLLTIINIIVTIWLTIVINRFADHNTESQIAAERKIARLQLRNEALKELRNELNSNFKVLKATITVSNIDECRKTLNDFAQNYSYLFELNNIDSFDSLLRILDHAKSQLEGEFPFSIIQDIMQADGGRQLLLSDLGEAVLE